MIRYATLSDFHAICNVHFACFPDSFSTHLGKAKHKGSFLLTQYYLEFYREHPELFWVAENESHQIIGFCMGYLCENHGQSSRFQKRNRLRIALRSLRLALTANKAFYKKLLSAFGKKIPFQTKDTSFDEIPVSEQGDLLSICVLPEYRGSGTAQALVSAYLEELKKLGCKLCLLTVETENARGVRFYEKQGFSVYKEATDYKLQYAKRI